jgi:hypothetical protein
MLIIDREKEEEGRFSCHTGAAGFISLSVVIIRLRRSVLLPVL